MDSVEAYKNKVLDMLLDTVKNLPQVLGSWEGGSAATGYMDQYSDIDLCLVADAPIQNVIEKLEEALKEFGVIHTWQVAKNPWGEGMVQRIFILKDSPKYFMVDIGVMDKAHPQLIKDFLEVERHGNAVIYFDKSGLIKPGHTDAVPFFKKQKNRLEELDNGFVIFKLLVEKEYARGNRIDAFGFYQNGLLRPLIEVLGMLHRPFKHDFGMRYIHKTFPLADQQLVEDLAYVGKFEDLPEKLKTIEPAFKKAVEQARAKLAQ